MKHILPSIILMGFLVSCSITKIVYGTKKPKIESEASVKEWLKKNNFKNAEVLAVSPDDFYFFVPRFLKSIFLFDKSGRFLAYGYHQGRFCIKEVDKLIENLPPPDELATFPDSFIVYQYYEAVKIENVKEKSRIEIEKIVKEHSKNAKILMDTLFLNYSIIKDKLRTLSGQPYVGIQSNPDYILFLLFAKYEGNRLQVGELRKYYRAAFNAKKSKIEVIFLNLDKQSWWGEIWNEKIRILN